MKSYSVRFECYAVRDGKPETFPEHFAIFAHSLREARMIAARIDLDTRRRKLIHVIPIC